ncbi:MAG: hypothetical protein ABIW50_06135 [Candidatus Limnocylindria bacterium]
MRIAALLLGLALAIAATGPVAADDGLTRAIATAYFPRNADADLHAIAHERAAELAACECLEHDGMRSETAEVVAWNSGKAEPVGSVVSRWQASAGHDKILSNQSYGRIGCAETVTGDTHWFACVLASGPLPATTGGGTASGPLLLPDTALPAPGSHAARLGRPTPVQSPKVFSVTMTGHDG